MEEDIRKIIREIAKYEVIKIPVKFWNNKKIVYMLDGELYDIFLPPLSRVDSKYSVHHCKRFPNNRFLYLMKFFYMASKFSRLNTFGLSGMVGGVPTNLKIKCICNNILDHKLWVRGEFDPSLGSEKFPIHMYYLKISEECSRCNTIICIYRPKIGVIFALNLFLHTLVPNSRVYLKMLFPNRDLKYDINNSHMVIAWASIIDKALNANYDETLGFYKSNIKKFVNSYKENPNLDIQVKALLNHFFTSIKF